MKFKFEKGKDPDVCGFGLLAGLTSEGFLLAVIIWKHSFSVLFTSALNAEEEK